MSDLRRGLSARNIAQGRARTRCGGSGSSASTSTTRIRTTRGRRCEETLVAFGGLIEDGLIGYAAASNYSAERLARR